MTYMKCLLIWRKSLTYSTQLINLSRWNLVTTSLDGVVGMLSVAAYTKWKCVAWAQGFGRKLLVYFSPSNLPKSLKESESFRNVTRDSSRDDKQNKTKSACKKERQNKFSLYLRCFVVRRRMQMGSAGLAVSICFLQPTLVSDLSLF